MTDVALLIGNSNVLELRGLRNATDDTWLNNATVAAVIQDTDGVDLAGMSWPVALNYVAESDGVYRALLDPALALVKDRQYKITLAAQGAGLTANWERYVPAKIRRL